MSEPKPRRPWDPEDSIDGEPNCGATGPGAGYSCTQRKGHAGDHVARTFGADWKERWRAPPPDAGGEG